MGNAGAILGFILLVAVLLLIKYGIRYIVGKGVDKAGDAIRNRRIERQQREGLGGSVESLADRYRSN